MTISNDPGDQRANDSETTRGLGETMRWWSVWTLRWMVVGLFLLLLVLVASGIVDAL